MFDIMGSGWLEDGAYAAAMKEWISFVGSYFVGIP